MRITTLAVGLLLLIGSVPGCAVKLLHTDSSTSAIRSAEESGAQDVPDASLHLQLAKEELQAAIELNAAGKRDEAKSLLLRAEADAELAVAQSQAAAEKSDAQTAVDRVRALQSENPYSTGGVN